jgi:hypothetical protein
LRALEFVFPAWPGGFRPAAGCPEPPASDGGPGAAPPSVSFNTGRSESPKIGLGPHADAYLEHYYGSDYFAPARSDTLTSAGEVRAELARLAGAGCTDVVLYPCSGDPDEIERLSQALRSATAIPDA